MQNKLKKTYPHLDSERKWRRRWKEASLFAADDRPSRITFSVALPPQRFSGSIRDGGVLELGLADVVVRRKRMQGFPVLWIPGKDHAGNALQTAKAFSGPVKRLGLSLDWTKEKSTSGEGMRRVVRQLFVRLHREGLIYRAAAKAGFLSGHGAVAAPQIRRHWFLRAGALSAPAAAAVREKRIGFIPEKWDGIFLHWLEDLRDWRISRKLTRGHRVPAYHCRACGEATVAEETPPACLHCGGRILHPDDEVLDTWFSSAIWPLIALGGQEWSEDCRSCQPASIIAAGVDILFCCVSRMIVLGLYFCGEVPFREVLVNGPIGKEKGGRAIRAHGGAARTQKLIDTYGADAMRFAVAIQAVPGVASSLPLTRIRGCKAFANKVWNAGRFVLRSLTGDEDGELPGERERGIDRWILHQLNALVHRVNEALDAYRTSEASGLLYHFVRDEYCGWYIEFSKCDLDELPVRRVLRFTFIRILQLLHPFMPFITEEIYRRLGGEKEFLVLAGFPRFDPGLVCKSASDQVETVKKLIGEARRIRSENRFAPGRRMAVYLKASSADDRDMVRPYLKYFDILSGSLKTELVADFSGLGKGFSGACPNWEILMPFADERERQKEIARLEGERRKFAKQIAGLEKKLAKTRIAAQASPADVHALKRALLDAIGRRNKIEKTLAGIS